MQSQYFSKRFTIIYDGDCAFCVRSIGILRKVDLFGGFSFCNSRNEATMSYEFPHIHSEDTQEAMLVISDNGSIYKGFYAFRQLIWASPYLWIAIPIFYFPGAQMVGTCVYRWVARNRRRFGCQIKFLRP